MEREGAQGWLAAESFSLLCLDHRSITSSCCQRSLLTQTELRGSCTGKQPFNAACISPAITRLELPCCPKLCVVLGAQMKGNGKLTPPFQSRLHRSLSLLAGRGLALSSWPKTWAHLWPSFALGNWTEPNPLTGRNFHKFHLLQIFPLMLPSHEWESAWLILTPAGPILIQFWKIKIYDAVLLKKK